MRVNAAQRSNETASTTRQKMAIRVPSAIPTEIFNLFCFRMKVSLSFIKQPNLTNLWHHDIATCSIWCLAGWITVMNHETGTKTPAYQGSENAFTQNINKKILKQIFTFLEILISKILTWKFSMVLEDHQMYSNWRTNKINLCGENMNLTVISCSKRLNSCSRCCNSLLLSCCWALCSSFWRSRNSRNSCRLRGRRRGLIS